MGFSYQSLLHYGHSFLIFLLRLGKLLGQTSAADLDPRGSGSVRIRIIFLEPVSFLMLSDPDPY